MSITANEFTALNIRDLIAKPLLCAADAQAKLAGVTANFIRTVGLNKKVKPTSKKTLLSNTFGGTNANADHSFDADYEAVNITFEYINGYTESNIIFKSVTAPDTKKLIVDSSGKIISPLDLAGPYYTDILHTIPFAGKIGVKYSATGPYLPVVLNADLTEAASQALYTNAGVLVVFGTYTEFQIKTFGGTVASSSKFPNKIQIIVPLLALIHVPSFFVTNVKIHFDMTVKTATEDDSSFAAQGDFNASLGLGIFSASVQGSVGYSSASTRTTDTSATYSIDVEAKSKDNPEGLMKVLDLLSSAIPPATGA